MNSTQTPIAEHRGEPGEARRSADAPAPSSAPPGPRSTTAAAAGAVVRITLRDVAAAAGVSLTAASFALNGTGTVSEETRRRVTAGAAKLGYKKDQRISEIMRRVRLDHHATYRETIAVLDTSPTRGGWRSPGTHAGYHKGMLTRAAALGYDLQEHWLGEPGLTASRVSGILRARGIRGVIIPPVVRPEARGLLEWQAFAIAAIGPSLDLPINRVSPHHFRTVRTAVDRLLDLGYRRLGFVMARPPVRLVEEICCSGFVAYQAKLPSRQRVPLLLHEAGDWPTVERWYHRHRPDAVLVHDTDQATALESAGLVAGKTGAIVHLDCSPASPGFAGMEQRAELVGATAIECVMGQLLRNELGPPAAPQEILINSIWRDGPSAPPAPTKLLTLPLP